MQKTFTYTREELLALLTKKDGYRLLLLLPEWSHFCEDYRNFLRQQHGGLFCKRCGRQETTSDHFQVHHGNQSEEIYQPDLLPWEYSFDHICLLCPLCHKRISKPPRMRQLALFGSNGHAKGSIKHDLDDMEAERQELYKEIGILKYDLSDWMALKYQQNHDLFPPIDDDFPRIDHKLPINFIPVAPSVFNTPILASRNKPDQAKVYLEEFEAKYDLNKNHINACVGWLTEEFVEFKSLNRRLYPYAKGHYIETDLDNQFLNVWIPILNGDDHVS